MISLDTTRAPLVVVRWVGEIDQTELDRYLTAHEGLLDSEIEYAILVDVARAAPTGNVTDYLCEISDWLDSRAPELKRTCRACAIVVRGEGLRRAIDVFCELRPLDLPTHVFSDSDAAANWLEPVLADLEPGSDTPPAPPNDPLTEPGDPEEFGLGAESSSPETLRTPNGSSANRPERTPWSPYNNQWPKER